MQPTDQQPTQEQSFYRPQQPAQAPQQPAPPHVEDAHDTGPQFSEDDVVTWEASEYMHRSKDFGWIVGFVAIVVLLIAISAWFRAWTFTALIVVMAVAMGVFAFRPPKIKRYTLTHQGLKIDDKMYNLEDFRAFGILTEGAFFTALLIPTKRFVPAVTVYFSQQEGDQIVAILGAHLPMEELHPDPIDALMRRLHF